MTNFSAFRYLYFSSVAQRSFEFTFGIGTNRTSLFVQRGELSVNPRRTMFFVIPSIHFYGKGFQNTLSRPNRRRLVRFQSDWSPVLGATVADPVNPGPWLSAVTNQNTTVIPRQRYEFKNFRSGVETGVNGKYRPFRKKSINTVASHCVLMWFRRDLA